MARLHSCNILHTGANDRRLWQFDAGKFTLNREQAVATNQPLPGNMVGKTWRSLWQPKLNIAWLPAEKVFLRVIQLPKADDAETRSMVEFQLEKLSPVPVSQAVWSLHLLPGAPAVAATADQPAVAESQTVVIVIVARALVEEFLGKLERDGFFADRLEISFLDQLKVAGDDGAWIFLDEERRGNALVAWRENGVLQSLGFINLPADRTQTAVLREQLVQMTWAGELEGWINGTPRWHLVAGGVQANAWQNTFAVALESEVKLVAPPSPVELAAATARRAKDGKLASVLPAEYSTRYHQQFVDRLYLRALSAILLTYIAGVVVYFIAVRVLVFQADKVDKQLAEVGGAYTNTIVLKARCAILKEREDLKYAALDSWKTTADLMPVGATLTALDFKGGTSLSLSGTAPSDQVNDVINFNTAMRKAEVGGQLLFSRVDTIPFHQDGNVATWNFSCELNRSEESK